MKRRRENTALANLMNARLANALREKGFDTTKDNLPDVLGQFKYQQKFSSPAKILSIQDRNERFAMFLRAHGIHPGPITEKTLGEEAE